MITVYLCGGINGLSDSQCKDWREYVKKELEGQCEFLDPMRRDYRGKEDESVDEIVDGDYDDIYNSDIILVNASKPSWGTAMEMHEAYMCADKMVVTVCDAERVSPWLRYHSSELVDNFEDAIRIIKEEIAYIDLRKKEYDSTRSE